MIFTYRQATAAEFDLTFLIKSCSIKRYVEMIWGWDEQIQLEFHRQEFDPQATKIIPITIRNLLIHRSAQGRSIGNAIISSIIKQAQATNQGVELQVYQVNHRAKKLYERLGFLVVGQNQMALQGQKANG